MFSTSRNFRCNKISRRPSSFNSASYKMPFPQLLWFENDPSFMGGVLQGVLPLAGSAPRPSSPRLPISYPLSPLYSHSSALFCTFLHASKTQLSSFQRFRTVRRKTARRGVFPPMPTRIKMNLARTNSISNGEALGRRQHCSIRSEASPRPRFASPPHCFLVNYIDPVLYSAGPAGHLSHLAPRPRS